MKQTSSHHFRVSLFSSVRTRLTLWYLGVMALVICAFGGSLYASATWLNPVVQNNQTEAQLYQDSSQFVTTYKQALLASQPLAKRHLDLSSQELVLLLGSGSRVLDARGSSLTSGMIQQLRARGDQNSGMISLAVTQSHSHGWGWWGTRDSSYRFLITAVLNQNAHVATLLVGLPLQSTSLPLLAIWLLHGTLALLIATLGGYWLAGRALRPVKMITHMANEINASDLRRRLHLRRQDEFGELAATFDQMLARLEAAFKRQTRFIADASHELRTPLAIIDLEINRALTQLEQPEDYLCILEQLQAENAQMTAIVNSLLLLARADTGQMMLNIQEVDLSDLVLASVERLVALARQYQITLAIGDLPEMLVHGDPHYLGQLLANLIENGIKYSSGNGKRVSVNLSREQERWAIVSVQDDGPGIAEEHLPLLFERFYRVDKARTRKDTDHEKPGGSGLGLSIVQWIVQAHGGQIRVISTIGAGSLFEVRLPLLKPAEK